jgi:hypothetical protein
MIDEITWSYWVNELNGSGGGGNLVKPIFPVLLARGTTTRSTTTRSATVGPLQTALAEALPAQPATYPVDDEEQSIIVEGLLAVVRPALSDVAAGVKDLRRIHSEWTTDVKKKRAAERTAAEQEMSNALANHDFDAVVARGKERQKSLVVLESELTVRLRRCQLRQRQARAADPPPPPPVAPRAIPLPTMQLKKFNGDRAEWRQFSQTFRAIVHGSAYHNLEKFRCLLGLLEGEAARVVGGLSFEAGNYQVCLDLLDRAYGDDEAAARELRLRLQQLPSAKEARAVKALYTDSETIIRQLLALGQAVASDETILVLEQKLPGKYIEKLLEKRKQVSVRPAPGNVWNLEAFRNALGDIVADDDKVYRVISQVKSLEDKRAPQQAQQGVKPRQGGPSIAFASYNPAQESKGGPGVQKNAQWGCAFCGEKHSSRDCRLDIGQRRERMRLAKKCFQCLRPGHFVGDCRGNKCWKCGKAHHPLVCLEKTSVQSRDVYAPKAQKGLDARRLSGIGPMRELRPYEAPSFNQQVRAPNSNDVRQIRWQDQEQPQAPAGAVSHQAGGSVAAGNTRGTGRFRTQMMCCKVTAYNLCSLRNEFAVVFIDPGSSESYITEAFAAKLALANGPLEQIQVARFGDREPNCRVVAHKVHFGLVGVDSKTFGVCALKVDHILSKMAVVDFYEEGLIDNEGRLRAPKGQSELDILLGIDHLNQIELSFERGMGDGLALYTSGLGPIICGRGRFHPRLGLILVVGCRS